MNSTKIIIIGTNHHNTLSMVRCFGEEGLMVILYIYGDNNSFIASSVYVETVSYFHSANDAVNSIANLSEKEYTKPIVIACSDEVSSLMDNRYDELIHKCYFFNAGKAGRITYYMDKQQQLELAKQCGFSTPNVSIDAFPNDINIDDVNFPCLVKPRESIHGGKNIAICRNSKELKNILCKYSSLYKVLVQDYIQKDYEIVIIGLSLDGDIFIPGFVQKHREDKGGTTYSTVKPLCELEPHLVNACKQLIRKIGYMGLWGIECLIQGENYFFIELNMRNDATTYAMKIAGVNLPYIFSLIVESKKPKIEYQVANTINAIVEFNDFNFVLKGKVCLFKWLKEYNNSECKYFHSSKDPMPYILKKKEYIQFLCRRILKF